MRVLHVSHISSYTPPIGYGGIELVVHLLAKHQLRLGIDVLVLGIKPKNVIVPYRIVNPFRNPIRKALTLHKVVYGLYASIKAMSFDIVHVHMQSIIPFLAMINKRLILTLHADVSPSGMVFQVLKSASVPVVAISKSQEERMRKLGLNVVKTIYHGIDVQDYPFCREKEDFLLYLARIDWSKGAHIAIEVAKRSGLKLVMIGPIANESYFNTYVKPFIGRSIIYLGEVDTKTKLKHLCEAKALIYPVQYEEFFGLAVIEALASGTPVVAFARGSLPEIVETGVTGFTVNTVEEMLNAVKEVDKLDPLMCRRRAEERFSAERMAKEYLELYKEIL